MKIKKIFVFLTILGLIIGSLPFSVMAQAATGSAQNSTPSGIVLTPLNGTGPVITVSSDSSTFSASQNNPFLLNSQLVPTSGFSGPGVSSIVPVFDSSNQQPLSNITPNINTKWTIAPNIKHDFKGDEDYQVNLDNIFPQNVNVEVFDDKGNLVSVDFQKLSTANGTQISILPPRNFKPGKYTLKITDKNGNTQTQDFTWGVLAINTNKSIYLPNETANLAMAVLSDSGDMVCNAQVTLTITDPNGKITTLSTSNGRITVNPQCQLHSFSLTPDYQANYLVGGAGKYDMTLTAVIPSGRRTIADSFLVQNSVPFDVERITGTRIYPPATYPVNLNIKVNRDFNGQIIDYVPDSFQIFQSTNSAAPKFEVKQIATPVVNSNGTVSNLSLSFPFKGTYTETLGFGQKLLDPEEKDLYAQFGLAGHDGLDFAMPIGTPVLAADNGTVVMAGGVIYGTTIVIQHSWGRSYYGHLSKVEVTLGQTVTKGEEIGLSGNTGITTGPHLHFGIKLNSNNPNNGFYGKVDPSPYLGITTQSQNIPPSINDTVKAVIWNVNVKKGDVLNLSYGFKSPNVSPAFYTLGPLSFYDTSQNLVFREARLWQLAIDVSFPATSYLSNTASGKITSTTSWQIVTTAPASADTTTSLTADNKATGYIQFLPGTSSSTNQASAPTSPDGKGFIYDTVLDSTIPTGTWQFNVQTNTGTTHRSTNVVTVCVWQVTISGGSINTSTSIIPCTDSSTDIDGATGAVNSNISVSGVSAVSFTSSQYLYVEYWEHETSTGTGPNANITWTFQTNAGSTDDIVTPGASSNLSPNAPTGLSTTSIGQTIATLQMTATDPESDNVQYDALLYANDSSCSTGTTTDYNQNSSQTGWSGQNATCVSGSDCYTSGTQGTLSVSSLTAGINYSWKARAIDPQGSNAFGSYSACTSFTTASSGPTLGELLRHGEWFNSSGVRQPFTF